MILGLDRHPAARCLVEVDDALAALGAQHVVLNAHAFPTELPFGATVYNTENVGIQVSPHAFGDAGAVWDFSARNVRRWKRPAVHVPIGWHPSMSRFTPLASADRDIDVVFAGHPNERREAVVADLRSRGIRVVWLQTGDAYGADRDAVFARARLSLNMLYHEDADFSTMRAAHHAANGAPMLHEEAPGAPPWATLTARYEDLAYRAERLLRSPSLLEDETARGHAIMRAHPMELPS